MKALPNEEDVLGFLKEAFCIDGKATIYKNFKIDEIPSVMFKLTDSKRGEFYVTLSKPIK